ncbi:hypothetical protein GVN16_18720 [Emticicia sp. CRIBPO]|uniref:Pr6Pr family membrane protein n=1 Tax=Emticicia sp. CRIBPO TaxID=2683258 RepID=UPI0014134EEB|nr:Pr6Pr family membrane protein [Emticicia sp. CRIBPO]NBA87810.1 hypothetical protein [Emticicia sp. CRIBPO]
MKTNLKKPEKIFLALGTLTSWTAVILQFGLIIYNRTDSVPMTILRFFSYFTILSNILVALCFSYLWLRPQKANLFAKPANITAVAVYITIVGIVYNTVLRSLWQPQGLQYYVDELLHSVVPIMFVLYWLVFAPKNKLEWKNAFSFLLYPLAYMVYIFVRGAISGEYPYPFVDANALGYEHVIINCAYLFVAFLSFSLAYIAIGKLIEKVF